MLPAIQFYIIRHGESEANRKGVFSGNTDSPLTDTGRWQAQNAAALIGTLRQKPSVIIHSHLSRARETAEIINTELGLKMHENEDLGEHRFGEWEMQPYKGDIHERFHAGENPPGGETKAAFQRRVQRGLTNTLNKYPPAVLIVCHGGIFRAFTELYNQKIQNVTNCALYKFTPAPDKPDFPWTYQDLSIEEID